MAGRISVKITKNRLPAIASQLVEASDVIVNKQRGPQMEARAKVLVPVDTGELQDSIHWEATGKGEGQLVAGTNHAIFPEYGTVDQAAQPYIRPTFEEIGPLILEDFRNLERFLS